MARKRVAQTGKNEHSAPAPRSRAEEIPVPEIIVEKVRQFEQQADIYQFGEYSKESSKTGSTSSRRQQSKEPLEWRLMG